MRALVCLSTAECSCAGGGKNATHRCVHVRVFLFVCARVFVSHAHEKVGVVVVRRRAVYRESGRSHCGLSSHLRCEDWDRGGV